MTALLEEQFREALAAAREEGRRPAGSRLLSATGLLAAPILSRLVDEARETWHNLLVEVVPIKNRFFGETITVAGLLTGRDLMEQLRGREADILLLPRDMIRREGDCFLDDATPDEVAQALSMRVEICLLYTSPSIGRQTREPSHFSENSPRLFILLKRPTRGSHAFTVFSRKAVAMCPVIL